MHAPTHSPQSLVGSVHSTCRVHIKSDMNLIKIHRNQYRQYLAPETPRVASSSPKKVWNSWTSLIFQNSWWTPLMRSIPFWSKNDQKGMDGVRGVRQDFQKIKEFHTIHTFLTTEWSKRYGWHERCSSGFSKNKKVPQNPYLFWRWRAPEDTGGSVVCEVQILVQDIINPIRF